MSVWIYDIDCIQNDVERNLVIANRKSSHVISTCTWIFISNVWLIVCAQHVLNIRHIQWADKNYINNNIRFHLHKNMVHNVRNAHAHTCTNTDSCWNIIEIAKNKSDKNEEATEKSYCLANISFNFIETQSIPSAKIEKERMEVIESNKFTETKQR